MFDIAWSELLLIAIVALIFIGPKELPQVLHSLGKNLSKLRRSADDFRRQFEDSMREAGYEDLHKNLQENLQDFRQLNPANQIKNSIDRALNQDYVSQSSSSPAPVAPESTAAVESTTEAQKSLSAPQTATPDVSETAKPNGADAIPDDTISQAAAPKGEGEVTTQVPGSASVEAKDDAPKERAMPLV